MNNKIIELRIKQSKETKCSDQVAQPEGRSPDRPRPPFELCK